MATTTRPQIDSSLFKTSLELDADLLVNLSGILMHSLHPDYDSLADQPDGQKMPAFSEFLPKSPRMCSVVLEDGDDCLKKENSYLKRCVKEMGTYIELLNKERKKFRSLVIDMLRQRFWKILADDRAIRFFHAKMGGISAELSAKRLPLIEKELERAQKLIRQKETELRKLREANTELIKKLDKSNAELKKLILEDTKNKTETLESNSNSNGLANSFTVDPPLRSATITSDFSTEPCSYFKTDASPKRIEKFPTKKETQAKLEVFRSKNSSVRHNRMPKTTVRCCHYEYVEPDLESTQPIYQSKPKFSDSARKKP
jgi:hypothetical protein